MPGRLALLGCGYWTVISMVRSLPLLGCWMLTQARRLSVGSK